jgi:hypothetical protein
MARLLISTTLPPATLAEALAKLGIRMKQIAPTKELSNCRLIDADLTSDSGMTSSALRTAVMQIGGVTQALPVPDAEPG